MTEKQLEKVLDPAKRGSNAGCHVREFGHSLRAAHDRLLGVQPCDQMIWDVQELGICEYLDPAVWRPRTRLDLSEISQVWLRELFRDWGRDQTSADTLRYCFRATAIASCALKQRKDAGRNQEVLTADDATKVFDSLRVAKKKRTGQGSAARQLSEQYSAKHLRGFYTAFFSLIAYGRRSGVNIGAGFSPNPVHSFTADVTEDDEHGKALPNNVIRQLDSQIDRIGYGIVHGALAAEDTHQLFKVVYLLLRDTGRRPLEIASLKVNCLEYGSHGPVLVYDNHKSGRMGRRLPISSSTGTAIESWKRVRAESAAPMPEDYLFPGSKSAHQYLRTAAISGAIRRWANSIDDLRAGDVGSDGVPALFHAKKVYPYAFRHSYAQRHADNGTPIDVLRDLMDHQSVQTTSGYYTITADRKRAAVEIVGKLTVDRNGGSAPLTGSMDYQMRSIAVPFGNCVEPSNVKAGGHACPIRFQCAGCGFYRPDPSYIPAIEEHLNSLRADREIALAMDTAPFVIDNLGAQIASFEKVLATMNHSLTDLDISERARVEEASSTLRKARAGVSLPLMVKTPEGRPNS